MPGSAPVDEKGIGHDVRYIYIYSASRAGERERESEKEREREPTVKSA